MVHKLMAVITVAEIFCYITLMHLVFSWLCHFLLSFCGRNHVWNGGLFTELCSAGPVLSFFVSLCVNKPLGFQLGLFPKPGDDCFFWERVQNLQTLQPFLILIREKKKLTLTDSCLFWCYWHRVGDWCRWPQLAGMSCIRIGPSP